MPCDIYSQFHLNFKKRRIQFLYIFESYYCVVILAITVEIAFVCIYKFIYIVHSIVIICNLTCNLTSDKTKPKLFFYQLFTTIVSVPMLCEEYTNWIIEYAFFLENIYMYINIILTHTIIHHGYIFVHNTRINTQTIHTKYDKSCSCHIYTHRYFP